LNKNISTRAKQFVAPPPVLALALPSETGRVLSIQSHTVQGYVGNKSAVFPLQLLGYDVDPINSFQFSNHTGYPTFKGQRPTLGFDRGHNLLFYTHLLTGYIGSVSLNTVVRVVDKLRSVCQPWTYFCDPVLGDEGKLYVPEELLYLYIEKRIVSEQDGRGACNIIHAAGPSKVVITSINVDGKLLLIGSHQKYKGQPPEQFWIPIPKIPAYFTLPQELMTGLMFGWKHKYPDNLGKAAELSVSSLQALLVRTVEDYTRAGHDCQSSSLEIRLIQCQDDIRNPEIKYTADIYN
ncbi:pyridoxal kinase-like, partial [Salvia splendens]|uniref:pyridoxal kinase-like n=1 Tax=Salvia splendens TaxID=180675 RepID=UPI001C271DA5